MPTPSNPSPSHLTPTSIPDDFSARTTCPPELERLSDWDNPDTAVIDDDDAPDTLLSPASANAHPMTPSEDGIGKSDPDSKRSGAMSSTSARDIARTDEEAVVERSSPPGEPLRTARPPSSVTTPSISSLLRYEFSNVRVSDMHRTILALLTTKALTKPYLILSPFGKQVRRDPAVRPPGVQCRCGNPAC